MHARPAALRVLTKYGANEREPRGTRKSKEGSAEYGPYAPSLSPCCHLRLFVVISFGAFWTNSSCSHGFVERDSGCGPTQYLFSVFLAGGPLR